MTDRPEPVRCGKCNGFVYGPAAGELAEIVRRVRHSTEADPGNGVSPCQWCGTLYEVRVQPIAA